MKLRKLVDLRECMKGTILTTPGGQAENNPCFIIQDFEADSIISIKKHNLDPECYEMKFQFDNKKKELIIIGKVDMIVRIDFYSIKEQRDL